VRIPAENLVEDEAHVFQFEEYVIAFEYFLQVAVAELSDEVDVIEIIDGLALGDQDFDHAYDVGMFAIFEQDDLAQDSTCFWQRLEEVDDLFDGNVGVV